MMYMLIVDKKENVAQFLKLLNINERDPSMFSIEFIKINKSVYIP